MSRRESLLPAPYQTRPAEAGATAGAHRALRRLSLAATLAAYATIVLGAVVRVTGAGDACGDDWPVCNGRIVPEFDSKVLTEYVHRLATPVLVLLIGALAVLAWRRYRGVARVVAPASAAFALLFVQAGLGALVVRHGLNPQLVTAHLATALVLLGTLVAATAAAWTLERDRAPTGSLSPLAWLAAAVTFGVMLAGAYVRGEGAGLAFTDWPLMDGRVVPDLTGEPNVSGFLHRVAAAAAVVAVGWLAFAAWRRRRTRSGAYAFALLALVALGVQIVVGALNVWTRLAAGARVAHVGLAALVWALVVGAAATARVVGASRTEPQ